MKVTRYIVPKAQAWDAEKQGSTIMPHEQLMVMASDYEALEAKQQGGAAQSAPAGEREAATEAAYAAVVDGGWSSVKEMGVQMFQAGAAWQRAAVIPAEKPLPELMMASYHEAIGWNACRQAMLAAAPAQQASPAQSEKVAHSAQWPTTPGLSARPSDDDLWDQTLSERDSYHESSDKLTDAIAKHFGQDFGEHSNLNAPWENALEFMRSLAAQSSPDEPEVQRLRGWLPIDTAPRGSGEDGPSRVDHPEYVEPAKLLIWGDEGPVVGSYEWYYHEGYGSGAVAGIPAWRDNQGEPIFGASHWMPLPAAPALAASTGQEVE